MSYTVVNDYIMNMLESLGDDMNIGEFKKVWISKREEFENVLTQVAEPIGFPTQVGPQVGPQEPEPKTEVRKKVNGKFPSEYVMFCRLHREEVKVNNPKMKGVDITRELARLWKIEKADRVKKPKEIENKVEIEIEKKPKKETKTRLKKVLVTMTPSGLDVNFVDVESKQEGKQDGKQDGKQEGKQDGKQEGKEKKSEVKGKRKKVNKKENEKQSEEEYMIFCNENRLKIKEKHPDMNPLEVTRELAKEWKIHQLTTRDGIRNIIEQAIGN